MNGSKIQLSPEEMQLVKNSEWILTKQRVIEKVYGMFGVLSANMQLRVQEKRPALPEEVLVTGPKISRGEQYGGLPYVVLDYPRFFTKEHVTAVRTFFWWANYFSITLHLKGVYSSRFRHRVMECLLQPGFSGFYISHGGDEFSFNVADGSYRMLGTYQPGIDEIDKSPFVKISGIIPLEHWEAAPAQLLEAFDKLLTVIGG
jgi:hypothetical protein